MNFPAHFYQDKDTINVLSDQSSGLVSENATLCPFPNSKRKERRKVAVRRWIENPGFHAKNREFRSDIAAVASFRQKRKRQVIQRNACDSQGSTYWMIMIAGRHD